MSKKKDYLVSWRVMMTSLGDVEYRCGQYIIYTSRGWVTCDNKQELEEEQSLIEEQEGSGGSKEKK